jgi:hypothetical protein
MLDHYGNKTGGTSLESACPPCASGKYAEYGSTTCSTGCRVNQEASFLWIASGFRTSVGTLSKVWPPGTNGTDSVIEWSVPITVEGNSSATLAAEGLWTHPETGYLWILTNRHCTRPRITGYFKNPYTGRVTVASSSQFQDLHTMAWWPDGKKLNGFKGARPGDQGNSALFLLATKIGDSNVNLGTAGAVGTYNPVGIAWTPHTLGVAGLPNYMWRARTVDETGVSVPRIELINSTNGATLTSFVELRFPRPPVWGYGFSDITPTANQDWLFAGIVDQAQKIVQLYTVDLSRRLNHLVGTLPNRTSAFTLGNPAKTTTMLNCPNRCSHHYQCTFAPRLYCNATSLCDYCPNNSYNSTLRQCILH